PGSAVRISPSASAASATLTNATLSGPSSPTATLAKKNDPPHRIESDTNQDHTRSGMRTTWPVADRQFYPAAACNLARVSLGPRMNSTSNMPGTPDPPVTAQP